MVVLLSIGLAIIYGLKVNLSVALVSMVNYTATGMDNESAGEPSVELCPKPNATHITHKDGPFVWSSHTQGMMLSSYFWGYLVAMFPGSQMAETVSAKWVFFFAVALNIVCTLATPIACYLHIVLVYIMRIGEGLGGGVTFPTTHVLLAHWAPPTERSTMASIAFSGTILGTVDGPFAWSSQTQGTMLSSYYWGYLVAMFPGSQMAEVVSAKWVFFFAVSINIVCTLATPVSCYLHIALVYIMRIGQGLGGGVTFPTTHVLLAHWAPPAERSTMASIAFSGTMLGTVISNYLSGVTTLIFSWEWIFYSQGGLSIIWLFLWVIFVTDKPRQLKFISTKELEYIETSLGVSPGAPRKRKGKPPFVKILKSVPFWAILVAHTCSNWAFYMLLVNMPIYLKQILHFNARQTGTYSAIPYIAMWAFSLFIGRLLDFLRVKKKITTTFARRCATLIASAPVLLCLIGLCFAPCQKAIHVILLTIALTAMGAMYSGFMTNHIDIANNYAGTLMGMTNTFGTVPGIVGPLFVGALTNEDPSIASWRIIFYVTCGFLIVEIVVFTIFGSGEEQSWNKPQPIPEQQELK